MKNTKKLLVEGYLALLDGDYDNAENLYRKLYEMNPQNACIISNLVLVLIRRGKYFEAREILKKFLENERVRKKWRELDELKNMFLMYLLIEFLLGDFPSAVELFEETYFYDLFSCPIEWELIPNMEISLEDLLERYDDEELSKLQRLLATEKDGFVVFPFPRDARKFLYLILNKAMEKGNFPDATKAMIYRIFTVICLSLGKINEASNAIKKLPRDDTFSLLTTGKFEYCRGDLEKAYNIFKNVIKREDFKQDCNKNKRVSAIAYHNLGVIHIRHGDIEKGLRIVNKALKKDASCIPCWYTRAWALYLSERWSEAEQAFKALLQLNKTNPRIWYGLGLSLLMRGKRLKGLEALLKAIKLSPQSETFSFAIELARAVLESFGVKHEHH